VVVAVRLFEAESSSAVHELRRGRRSPDEGLASCWRKAGNTVQLSEKNSLFIGDRNIHAFLSLLNIWRSKPLQKLSTMLFWSANRRENRGEAEIEQHGSGSCET